LNIKHEQLKGYIKTYGTKIPENELVEHWSVASEIPKINFFRVKRYVSKEKYIRNRSLPSEYGWLEVYFSSVLVRDIVDNLANIIKTKSLESKEIALNFLKGLVAGEGSVKLVKNKLREVRIASCNSFEQEFIRRLLEILNIKPSQAKYKFYIAISGTDNFKKLKEFDVFEIHNQKRQKFNFGLKNLASGE
jgi:hypothetical protein